MKNISEFQKWLQKEREKQGWSQSELGRRSGLNRAIINKVEAGMASPSPETLLSLADAFNLSPEYIFQRAGLLPQEPEIEQEYKNALRKLARLSPERRRIAMMMLDGLLKEEQVVSKGLVTEAS